MPALPEGQEAIEFFTLLTSGEPLFKEGGGITATREGLPALWSPCWGVAERCSPSRYLLHDLFHCILPTLLEMALFKDPGGLWNQQ